MYFLAQTYTEEWKMKQLCKNCKWWERYKNFYSSTPLKFGGCSNSKVCELVNCFVGIDCHESFGCNFWEKRDEDQN